MHIDLVKTFQFCYRRKVVSKKPEEEKKIDYSQYKGSRISAPMPKINQLSIESDEEISEDIEDFEDDYY